MINPPNRSIILNTNPYEMITLIFSWHQKPVFGNVSHEERRKSVKQFYKELKKPLLDKILSIAEIKTENELENLPMTILSAPAKIWQQLLSEPNSVLNSNDFEITLNRDTYHIY